MKPIDRKTIEIIHELESHYLENEGFSIPR